MKALIVFTSHNDLGNTGLKSNFCIDELAAPFYTLKDAGAKITLASSKGGQPPVDPQLNEQGNLSEASMRYDKDIELQLMLANTKKLSEVSAGDFDAIFYPGGHGPLWNAILPMMQDPSA